MNNTRGKFVQLVVDFARAKTQCSRIDGD